MKSLRNRPPRLRAKPAAGTGPRLAGSLPIFTPSSEASSKKGLGLFFFRRAKRVLDASLASVLEHESRQSLFLLYASLRADARKRKAICKKKGYFFSSALPQALEKGAKRVLDASLASGKKNECKKKK